MPTDFTPFQSLIGGCLIGAAAVVLMATHGRIAGATGVLRGALKPNGAEDWTWRAAMLAGMLAAPTVYLGISGKVVAIDVPMSTAAIVIGGLLVGFGVVFGGGCTSGHGVCGMARLSKRSIIATLTFMGATFATVFLTRHGAALFGVGG